MLMLWMKFCMNFGIQFAKYWNYASFSQIDDANLLQFHTRVSVYTMQYTNV